MLYGLAVTNTLAYFASALTIMRKRFITSTTGQPSVERQQDKRHQHVRLGVQDIKTFFFFVTDTPDEKAKVFLRPNLILAGKAREPEINYAP
jgi:hypothetical protein